MECIFENATRHHSPIWVKNIIQQPGLEGRLDIEFYHANYPHQLSYGEHANPSGIH